MLSKTRSLIIVCVLMGLFLTMFTGPIIRAEEDVEV